MLDIADHLRAWLADGRRFAIATVVQTWESAPRRPGASMAVAENGEVVGSVSGGCVEGAVYELALEVLQTGEPVLRKYGVTDGNAVEVGLTCGGTVEIYVQSGEPEKFVQLPALLKQIAAGEPVALAMVLPGDVPSPAGHLLVTPQGSDGSLGNPGLDAGVGTEALGLLAKGQTGVLKLGPRGQQRMDGVSVFVNSFAPPPRMLIFGAIDFASAVAGIGKFLGYHVTVCDARPVFATAQRFPDADDIVVQWPHRFLQDAVIDRRTVICVLTHDPKFDIPLLSLAVKTEAAYIGVMGSRRTHADRIQRLREIGVVDEEIARLSSPIGLDLGARTPQETAVAIAAEIIAATWGGTGTRLSDTQGPIHPD
ncbi:MAG: hypothetical protein JWM76_2975 [Pseudonocardiales bacterium]|nr:hypothetical protein [Pseudonocardiales bacterium]